MSRQLIDTRSMQSSCGQCYLVHHFVHIIHDSARNGATVVKRRDSFETADGHTVLLTAGGRFSMLVDGKWIDLVDCDPFTSAVPVRDRLASPGA